MIVLDEQLYAANIQAAIERWYRGKVVQLDRLRPGTLILDDVIPTLLRSVRQPVFVTINAADFWRQMEFSPKPQYDDHMTNSVIKLTPEQRGQLKRGKAVDVTDPETAELYVLMPKAVYENACRLVHDDSDWTDDELRLQLARSAKDNGWEETAMDAYDRYDEELSKRCP